MPRYVEAKSESAFRTAKTGPKHYLLSDDQGLSLRIRPNGAKTQLLRYRRLGTGKENFLSLGPYPDVSLIEAWRRTATARDFVREGTDPVEQSVPTLPRESAQPTGPSISSPGHGLNSSVKSGRMKPTARPNVSRVNI